MDRQTEIWTNKQKYGQTDRSTDRQTDRQTNRQTNKQTDRHTNTQTHRQRHIACEPKNAHIYRVTVSRNLNESLVLFVT